MNKRSLVVRLIVVAALLAAIVWLALHRSFLEPSVLDRELHRFGRLAPILFVLLYAVGTVLFVPGSIITVAGRRSVRPGVGNPVESHRRDPGRRARLCDRPLRRVGLGFQARGRTTGSADAGSRRRRVAFCGLRAAGAAVSVQSGELRLRTDTNPASRVCARLLYIHGSGRVGVYLSGLRGARSRLRAGRGNPQGSACPGAACGRRFPAAAGAPAQGAALYRRGNPQRPAGERRRNRPDRRAQPPSEFSRTARPYRRRDNIPIAELSGRIRELSEIKAKAD